MTGRSSPTPEHESDSGWGRMPGAAPPLRPSAPLIWWVLMTVVLVTVVLVAVGGPGPLGDPSPGNQRPGLLVDPGDARLVAGLDLPGRPLGRRPVFLAFDRRIPTAAALRRVLDDVPEGFARALAVPRTPWEPPRDRSILPVVTDYRGSLAAAVGLPTPKDGGPPVGYAVIDADARVRYATLDPTWTEHRFEIAIVTRALR